MTLHLLEVNLYVISRLVNINYFVLKLTYWNPISGELQCQDDEFSCNGNDGRPHCFPNDYLCDNYEDCNNWVDESQLYCTGLYHFKGNFTWNQTWACFVLYLKIINTLSEKLKTKNKNKNKNKSKKHKQTNKKADVISVGQMVLELLITICKILFWGLFLWHGLPRVWLLLLLIIKPYLSAHEQQIQTTIYNEKQYETNITKLIRNIKKLSF